MILSAFASYNVNLELLSFCNLISDCASIWNRQLLVEVERRTIKLSLDNDEWNFVIEFDDSVQLEPATMSSLRIAKTTVGGDRLVELSFCVGARLESLPPQRPVINVAMPVNFELLNDWIFCHNHSSNDHIDVNRSLKQFAASTSQDVGESTAQDSSTEQISARLQSSLAINNEPTTGGDFNSACLTDIDQVAFLLSSPSCSKFLLESSDKRFSLFMQVINRQWIVAHTRVAVEAGGQTTLKLKRVSSVYYKLFNTDCQQHNKDSPQLKQLSTYRHSFEIEWFLVRLDVFNALLDSLIRSSKSLLPVETRFQTDHNSFVHGYLDF